MTLDKLVDSFVARVNAGPRNPEVLRDVPVALRLPLLDEFGVEDDLSTDWQIIPVDNTTRIDRLEHRMGVSFPLAFRALICRYSFPAFECGPVMFFANTGRPLEWELEERLFKDPVMSPFLLKANLVQIGTPMFYDYDPVCLEARPGNVEGAVVQIDHEAILCNNELVVRRTIAPGFQQLLQTLAELEA